MITARDYAGFRALLNNRRIELGLKFIDLNALAGFPEGYGNKLLLNTPGKHTNIGFESLGKLLKALGVEIQLVPAVAGSSENASYPQAFLRERARRGGLARYAKMTRSEVREFARKGGLAKAAKLRNADGKVNKKG